MMDENPKPEIRIPKEVRRPKPERSPKLEFRKKSKGAGLAVEAMQLTVLSGK
jgi:hypothetical protein